MTSPEREALMTRTRHVYVTYIASTPQRIWDALLKPEFTRTYWDCENVSDWKPGSRWENRKLDGEVQLLGTVLESDPPRRLVITWASVRDEKNPGAHTRVTFELEPIESMVQLTVTHDQLEPGSDMEKGIMAGWPRVLSSLKSLLETGKPLPTWAGKKS
jgi:uncharacterized protein YndB with AHSA1/START domain